MSTTTFDQYLMADHRDCDALLGALRQLAGAGDWEGAGSAFQSLRKDVLAHFAAEEEVLFPAFEAASGMTCGPTRVMRMEHDEVRDLLEDLSLDMSEQDGEGVRGHGEALLILLQQHNMKEEHILYPAALQSAGAQAAELSAQVIARREAA
ncbi:hemerythrin domain-containing protein [Uliginosibacterium sp. 31-16]|uniref:hemerythrin domain-containing protein n=1 Tax=Uliginosibacterium sp. 31-16 TaxID=3068315 RepID=UPI00273D4E1A|nr:hemerythrin domain-containing protein [Uliginosibacterium sp. 31-16]MDP5239278.1 hemerythrin domain-containing protein [Uliginosibacterium sp. 31-16]